MSSKIITTAMVAVVIGPFAYIAASDFVSVKHNLQRQNTYIQQLSVENDKLDEQLNKTAEVKEQTVQEVQQLENQTQDAVTERQKLETELGAN